MKELQRFRQFLAEGVKNQQVNESELPKGSPAMEENEIQDFLSRQLPEEWPGSWTGDMMTGTFTAPYEHIMLATDQDDVEDYFYGEEEMIDQLPTEWVKVEEYTTGKHNGIDYQVMNFAKYVPGEGVYVAATTDEIGGSVNEIADTNTGEIARDVYDNILKLFGFEGIQLPEKAEQELADLAFSVTDEYLASFPEDQAVSRSDISNITSMAIEKKIMKLFSPEVLGQVKRQADDTIRQARQDNNQLPLRYDTAFTDIERRIGSLASYYNKVATGTDNAALILKPEYRDRSFSDEVIAKAWLK